MKSFCVLVAALVSLSITAPNVFAQEEYNVNEAFGDLYIHAMRLNVSLDVIPKDRAGIKLMERGLTVYGKLVQTKDPVALELAEVLKWCLRHAHPQTLMETYVEEDEDGNQLKKVRFKPLFVNGNTRSDIMVKSYTEINPASGSIRLDGLNWAIRTDAQKTFLSLYGLFQIDPYNAEYAIEAANQSIDLMNCKN